MLAADWQLDLTLKGYITTPFFAYVSCQTVSSTQQSDVDKIILKCQWFVRGTFSLSFFFCRRLKKSKNYQCTCDLDVNPCILSTITVMTGLMLTCPTASQGEQKHTCCGFAYCLSCWTCLSPLEYKYKNGACMQTLCFTAFHSNAKFSGHTGKTALFFTGTEVQFTHSFKTFFSVTMQESAVDLNLDQINI